MCYLWPKLPEAFMAQLTYDELRLLRQLERGDQTISDNQPRGGLNRLVDEGYVMRDCSTHPRRSAQSQRRAGLCCMRPKATTNSPTQVSKLRPLGLRRGDP